MNEYKIYQVPNDDPVVFCEYAFSSLDWILNRHPAFRGGEDALATLPRYPWKCVYVYRTEKKPSLDWIYRLFNRGQGVSTGCLPTPADFEGHSLSVSDIIEDPAGRLWFCDSLGWKEIIWQSN